jgi:hypothetical protein
MSDMKLRRHLERSAVRAIATAMLTILSAYGCGKPREQRLDFTPLSKATRVEVTVRGYEPVATISRKERVLEASAFIQKYPDKWRDSLSPAAPEFMFEFYDGTQHIGGFGVGRTYVTNGSLSRELPPDEIVALVRKLELPWSPKR